MTTLLFRDDAYAKSCTAKVTGVNDRGGIILDQTVFYATAGGQPGDKGALISNGNSIAIATTVYDEHKNVVHIPAEGQQLPAVGDTVMAELDWGHRSRIMRCHTMMHLLCAAVPFAVTGSAITEDGGRIDFDIPEGQIPDRTALSDRINGWIREDHPVTTRWITDEELDANPELVRTMFVKPPRGTGKVRLVLIGADGSVDLQPCGGTHVKSTGEIGEIAVDKIQNKGKINRRIRLVLANP
ncbi:MAG: alanyl-tRNA editing protein [Rhizobiales bacterium]|nr:alanyl-tRNA editing protein [Hyphomicrobiales bacterium]